MKMNKKFLVALMLVMLLVLTACSTKETTDLDITKKSSNEVIPTMDRAGNPVVIPEEINTIVSLAPSMTQVIIELGLSDKLIATDTQSPLYAEGISELPQFDMMAPDIEALAGLNPDIIFVSGMSSANGDNPYKQLIELGICVVTIPSSTSIEGVKEDDLFIADCLKIHEAGVAMNEEMQAIINQIATIGATIEDKKTVMFEISSLPYIYSFGSNTFLNEMIEIIGATNVFEDQESWISVTEEAAISENPDIILTNVNYIEDSVGEILARVGWEEMAAIKNKSVFYIDNGTSSLSNHHIVDAFKEMAKAIYPEVYADMN
jgi:iron complex transport system substrate-binding protein